MGALTADSLVLLGAVDLSTGPSRFYLGYIGGFFDALPTEHKEWMERFVFLRYPEMFLIWLATLAVYACKRWLSLESNKRIAPSIVVMGGAPLLSALLHSPMSSLASTGRLSFSGWLSYVPATLLLFVWSLAGAAVLAVEVAQLLGRTRWYPAWAAKVTLLCLFVMQWLHLYLLLEIFGEDIN